MAKPFPSAQGADPYADRRVHPRVEVALPAFLQAGTERHHVQIVDLSPGGAKLDCPAKITTGTAVTLDCGTLARTAVVRWQNGAVLGLCFDSELDARDVSALIERSKALAAWMKTRE
jgi:PilZ domain-containing protein